ncbi:MAG: hypothetical protein E7529_01725 [Ruminococcaceae bacterium]|nr:hypothetical protein [Oscillospiraceae bacterium]
MKKVLSLILILIVFCSFAITANAEEFNGADLFTVDLPEGFEQTGANISDFNFINENADTFTVSYNDNTSEDYIFCPANMSKKDIEEYTNALYTESANVMKDYADGFELKFLYAEKIKHPNGKKALVCQTKTTITQNKKDNIYYQTLYEFGGVDYKYTFTYTTTDEKKKDSFKEAFESINIFEGETESNSDKITGYAVAGGLVLLLVAGIVRFIRTPEKRQKGKIK